MRTSQYRLAIREDGHMIKAMLAEIGTMANAKLIATMSADLAKLQPETFEAFKTFASICVARMVEQLEGTKVNSMVERDPPPSERKGD